MNNIFFKRYMRMLCLMLSMLLAAAGCGGKNASGSADEAKVGGSGLKIVTTIFAPYDFARQLSKGTDNEITMLLDPGTEVHSYDPTVSDIISIAECDLFIYTGGENDEWVDEILEAIDDPPETLRMLGCVSKTYEEEIKEGMQSLERDDDDNANDSDAEVKDEASTDAVVSASTGNVLDSADNSAAKTENTEEETEWDEHVWTSPRCAAEICTALANELCRLDAGNKSTYSNNLIEYNAQLEKLDSDFHELVDSTDCRMMVFADRFPVRYFTEEYGLDYFAAYPGCAADAEPSAATLRFLIDKVREEKVPAVFYIEMSDERIADTVCEETGAKKLLFHGCHNVTADELKSGATYISLMRGNLDNLMIALL